MSSNASDFASPLAHPELAGGNLPLPVDYVLDVISNATISTWLCTLIAIAVAYDQVSYWLQKGSIVGPRFKEPFVGPFLQSLNPKMEEYIAKWKSGPLSCVSVFHKFVVIASTRDMARKIFNSPSYVKPCVVDIATRILGEDSWVFLDGKAHVDYRKGLNALFTRRSLEAYLPGQEALYDRYFKRYVQITKDAGGKPVPFMHEFRELMCAVSLRTFAGHYIPDSAMKKISDDYYLVTAALELVNFPIIIPYTKTWYGKKAADMVMDEFAKCAAKAKVRIAAGGEITCIMDAWIKDILDSKKWREATEKGLSTEGLTKPTLLLREFTDMEISRTLFTFLFASQDATSSACTNLFQVIAQRKDVLDRVIEENYRVRNGDIHAPVTLDQLESMTYTRAVVRELLRWRPPVIMVPYKAKRPFPITENYTVPKGAMIIPTTYMALRDPEVYENPDEFDPDRYYSGDAEVKGAKNYLVFGTGPHYCIGQQYAQLNLALCLGKASLLLDWKHHPTPVSEEMKVFATIFPKFTHPSRIRAGVGAERTSRHGGDEAHRRPEPGGGAPGPRESRGGPPSAASALHRRGQQQQQHRGRRRATPETAAAAAARAPPATGSRGGGGGRRREGRAVVVVVLGVGDRSGFCGRGQPDLEFRRGRRLTLPLLSIQQVRDLTTGKKKNNDPSSSPGGGGGVMIIDVREPSEVAETGRIPGSVNVPVASAPDSFHVPEDEFEDRFGFPRPPRDAELLFYCKAGVRSRAAAGVARDAGWSRVGEYPGSWSEWFARGGKVER
ncbi:hypothetical protein DL765_009649 [Monosporascus sp. GIB2]|nr:hypothetical protein DL765_009649 [Monosporascus sp. GIB2]